MGRYPHRAFFWVGIYLGMVLAPLLALLLGPVPGGNGFWYDLSMAFGFSGAAMQGTMFFLTARFQRATTPFGIDIIYYFHRWIALVAMFFILAHPVILLANGGMAASELLPGNITSYMLAGVGAVAALLGLMATSLWRKGLGIHYDGWRVAHALLATAALGLAFVHIEGVGNYVLTPWKRVLWAVITASWLAVLGYVRVARPVHALRHPWRVIEIRPERGKAWSLTLAPEGHSGFSFMSGQFAWLTLGASPFAMREHPFSISSSARHRARISFTIKEVGDFTSRIGQVRPGQVAYLALASPR
ncbi:MAG: ferric reductase-like transmembrane domain-containing protein [Deltaproteobacteria bacterium]